MSINVRKQRNKRLLMLIFLLTISIGFALLSTTLNINGFAALKSSTWDIRWDSESINVTEGSVETSEPTVSESDTKVSFAVDLE